ncbi:MAG: cation diffusion facilitator family transporter [Thermoanaerobaculales bacterium]|nr:cation diffusion facilitator family transporter [Thermoanaerobaculales bacterium]
MNDSASIQRVQRATVVGMGANIVLAAGKIAAGLVGSSAAVVADGVHSLTDLFTDIILLVGTLLWAQPPDERHPHGHRRIETLVTVGIGMSLAAVGIGMGWNAIAHLRDPRTGPATLVALVAALISVFSKEWLFHWTRKEGRAADSPALVANAWHHRSDAFSSIPAVMAVGTEMFFPRLAWVDRLGVLVICGFILWAAWNVFHPALQQLVDAGAPADVRERIGRLALEVDGVRAAHALRTRYTGPKLAVDLHLEVDGDLTVAEGFSIARAVKKHLLSNGPSIGDVVVQVEPEKE